MLRAYLLGTPRIEWEGQLLSIPRRQVRALLYRLAVRPQAIPREKLCFYFWPNISDTLARRHLSHLLSHLRKELPDNKLLQVTKNNVGLNPERTWSDTNTFEGLHTAGTREALQQAVDLYRGQFLSGFSLPGCAEFESWAADEGYRFEKLFLGILSNLIEAEIGSGNYERAIDLAQRYLAVDDLAEGIHRNLIELYSITGNRSTAMEQFERCSVVLERELGVSPMPETRAAYEAVLKNERPVSVRSTIQSSPISLPGLEVPMVGRQNVLRDLEQIWAQSKRGGPQVIFISGEAGIGKSRLIKAFVDKHIHETLILSSSCHPVKRPIPYQPLVEALAPVMNSHVYTHTREENGHLPTAIPFSLSKTWLAEAARLLPDLYTLYPDLPEPLPVRSDEARGRLFEALARLLLDLASKPTPFLLMFDDLHWADKVTLDWLVFFAHYLDNLYRRNQFGSKRSRFLILIAYRKEDEQALADLRRSLAKTIGFADIELSGLDAGGVQDLVENLIPSSSFADQKDNEKLTKWLQRVTGSNPFYLIETMHVLLEKELIHADLSDLPHIPTVDSIRIVVDERMKNLTSQAGQVLEACAVLNGIFDFDLIHHIAGRGELETIDGLEELTARQFLVEEKAKFKFRHDLIQQCVIDTLAPVRRQLLHRRAGEALEKLDPEAVTSLAYHYEKGNEPEKALHYYARSTQQAEQVFAWQEAEKLQKHMLTLLDQIDPECRGGECNNQRAQILASRAHMRYLQGRIVDRDQDLAALDTLAKSGSDELKLSAVMERVRYLNLDSHFDEAIHKAQEGLALSTKLEEQSDSARLLTQIGFAHYFLGQPRLALKALKSALAMTKDESDLMMRGRINHILGYVYYHLADYKLSLAFQREAFVCHRGVSDLNRVAWDGLDIGLLHLKMGQFSESKRHLDDQLALTRRISVRPPEAYGMTLLGSWHLYQGDYAKAKDYFSQAFDLQSALKSVQGCVAAEGGLGLCLYHLGELDQARQRLENAAKRARSITHRRRLVEVLDMLGLVEITTEQYAKACQYLKEAVAIARESEFYEGLYFGLAALARARRMAGEVEVALTCAQEAVGVGGVRDLPMNLFWGNLEMGLAHLAGGDRQAALGQIEQALTLLPQAHQAWLGTEQVYFGHAKVLQALGRFDEAEQGLYKAQRIIDRKADLIPEVEQRQCYLIFMRGQFPDKV